MIALASYGDIATGIGSEARWLWKSGIIDRWLAFPHRLGYGEIPRQASAEPFSESNRIRLLAGSNSIQDAMSRSGLGNHLKEITRLICIERPMPANGFEQAKSMGISTFMLVHPEWTPPGLPWIKDCDRFIALTDLCFKHLTETLKVHYAKVSRLQVPITLDEFPFRIRFKTGRVVFAEGWGGVHSRKGKPAIVALLNLAPESVIFKSQHYKSVNTSTDLYADADIVLAPSRFEGVGLTILEAMASGCPVLTTDAEPMREFVTAAYGDLADLFLLPVGSIETVKIWDHVWEAHDVSVPAMLKKIRAVQDLPPETIERVSRLGREYIEREHGIKAVKRLKEILNDKVPAA